MTSALTWTVGHSAAIGVAPATFVPATVPGAVQLDWARAHGWAPHTDADNWRDYAWMEAAFWTYRAALPPTALAGDQRLFLVCRGIDYRFAGSIRGRGRRRSYPPPRSTSPSR